MHFLKDIAAVTALCAVLATSVAVPAPAADASPAKIALKTREELADEAIVNVYSGTTCGGASSSFTVTGGSVCHAVSDAKSIEVSENDCSTYTWSGTNCGGSSLHISGGACVSVVYGSVSVVC